MEHDKNKLRNIQAYRSIDASYRVHTRLYKLHNALYHTEKTIFHLLKNNIITTGSVLVLAITSFTLLYVQIADVNLKSCLAIGTITIVLIGVYAYQYDEARKSEKELGMMAGEIKDAAIESWPDFLGDETSKWATRILMAKEILDENERTPINDRDKSYELTKNSFTDIIDECKNRLVKIKKDSEKLDDKYKDSRDRIIDICDEFI